MIGPTISPPIVGAKIIKYQGALKTLSRKVPPPGKDISDISLIKALIPIPANPASIPIIIAIIIMKVCSVILARSIRATVRSDKNE